MDIFTPVATKPLEWVKKWKEVHNKRVIGCLPMYVPEEIIAAAGILPVALPGRDGRIVLSSAYLHTNLCHVVRGNFESALSGELNFMDGLIFADICDQTKRLGNLWELYHHPPYSFHLRLPKRLDTKTAQTFYRDELGRFQASLEKFAGQSISNESLKKSIALYNKVRKLITRLYELRRNNPASFRSTEIDYIITAAMVMPKEEFQSNLAGYLETKQLSPATPKKARLVIVGSPCEDMEPGLLDMISDVGGLVVDDYVYSGSMYLGPSVPESGDPLNALARAYIDSKDTRPCTTKFNPAKSWGQYIADLARQVKAEGVIMVMPKYCEIIAFDYPEAKEKLTEAGIPHIMLEVEHSGADARLRTRLEAFMEMLR